MIAVEKLCFAHGDGGSIFENFSFRVKRGEAWTVIGPSGCGKTTLLYLIAGLKKPVSGRLFFGG